MDITDIIPKEALERLHWTCSDHPTCQTCVYYYCSCDGLSNYNDPRVINLPDNEKQYIQQTWLRVDANHRYYMHWKRLKDIGVLFQNLDQVKALTQEQIQVFIRMERKKS